MQPVMLLYLAAHHYRLYALDADDEEDAVPYAVLHTLIMQSVTAAVDSAVAAVTINSTCSADGTTQ